jgi:hypothetical protein
MQPCTAFDANDARGARAKSEMTFLRIAISLYLIVGA